MYKYTSDTNTHLVKTIICKPGFKYWDCPNDSFYLYGTDDRQMSKFY